LSVAGVQISILQNPTSNTTVAAPTNVRIVK
jgi:hypothetical protein